MSELRWDIEEDIACPHCDAIHKISPRQFAGWDWCPGFGFAEDMIVTCNDHQFTVKCDWDWTFDIWVTETT